jgi:hypothetical protein
MKKIVAGTSLSALATLAFSAAAGAQPNPNPNAPAHTGTACTTVVSNNPNAGPNGFHQSPTGGANFLAVGEALCGLTG